VTASPLRRFDGALVVLRCDDLSVVPPPATNVDIAVMDPTDGRAISEWLEVHNSAYGHSWERDDVERAILRHPFIDVAATFVVREEGRMLAAASVGTYRRRPDLGVGHYLGVRPEARHRGLARELVFHRYGWLAGRGVTAAETQTHIGRVGSLRIHFEGGFEPKYRLDPWNNPENVSRPVRALTSLRLRRTFGRWRDTRADGSDPSRTGT
jgi:GNAT superfamily N-acetyltransferase